MIGSHHAGDSQWFQELVDAVGGRYGDVPRALSTRNIQPKMILHAALVLSRLFAAHGMVNKRRVMPAHRHGQRFWSRATPATSGAGGRHRRAPRSTELIETAPKLLDALSDLVTTLPLIICHAMDWFNLADLSSDRVVLQPETLPDGSSTAVTMNNLRWDPQYSLYVVGARRETERACGGDEKRRRHRDRAAERHAAAQSCHAGGDHDLDVRGFQNGRRRRRTIDETHLLPDPDYTGNDDTARELAQALNVDEQYIRTQLTSPCAGKRRHRCG